MSVVGAVGWWHLLGLRVCPSGNGRGRLKDADRKTLERGGCSQPCCLPNSLGGEVPSTPTASCGCRTGKRVPEGSWGVSSDVQSCVSTSQSNKQTHLSCLRAMK